MRGLWSLVVVLSLACSSVPQSPPGRPQLDPNVARYRLQLRHNEVDPGAAFRCYGSCQEQKTPAGYLECLAQCPAFEVTEGVACTADEVPPVAACITARRLPAADDELGAGYVVLAVVANIALIVAASSVCTSSPNCTSNYYFYPGALPVSGPGRF